MKTPAFSQAFVSGLGLWHQHRHHAPTGLHLSLSARTPSLTTSTASPWAMPLRRPSTTTARAVPSMILHAEPVLMMQLAGCAALVGTGKYIQIGEEEEHKDEGWKVPEAGKQVEVDVYRDTWVRYFGYFNEVGEAFRPVIPVLLVGLSYVVAIIYVLADSVHQGKKEKDTKAMALAAIDSLFFQGFASVIFPSFTINRSVTMVEDLLQQLKAESIVDLPDNVVEYLPTVIGLLLIPMICAPLDALTHSLLDRTLRPVEEMMLKDSRTEEIMDRSTKKAHEWW